MAKMSLHSKHIWSINYLAYQLGQTIFLRFLSHQEAKVSRFWLVLILFQPISPPALEVARHELKISSPETSIVLLLVNWVMVC